MNEEFAWFRLLNTPGLGRKGMTFLYHRMYHHGLSPNDIFELGQEEFYQLFPELGNGKYSKVDYQKLHEVNEELILEQYQGLKAKEIKILPLDGSSYPKRLQYNLKEKSPPLLFCKGSLEVFNEKSVSIVGSRNTDEKSLEFSRNLAYLCAERGYNVVSGYAKGVDTNAHIGALEAGGSTSMVLSLGINNLSIKKDIKIEGYQSNSLFLSQFLPNEAWRSQNAMERNKVVCGLSQAVIVIGSGPRQDSKGRMSGTFDAAKSAIDLGIPVYVLSPETMINPPSGNLELIKLGAVEFQGYDVIKYLEDKGPENWYSYIQPDLFQ